MDETPIFYEINYNKTVAKIDTKKMNVKTFGTEKIRISVILSILANVEKLIPLFVFKGKSGKQKEKELDNPNIHCLNRKMLEYKRYF